ncbi:PREDICTED: N-terminal EF-hand calcium-binding protein 2 [Chaetura pelagica]|uniref:N-terminal EF-hand calcium-binding protein 2 n=1 Tax=Chaetura pelagica TaxID=8897 RepID=UPI000523BE23|nr:PREDICTED: N-terminal EF-hand calcium-binding protein 2 [Chaetura pelagica]
MERNTFVSFGRQGKVGQQQAGQVCFGSSRLNVWGRNIDVLVDDGKLSLEEFQAFFSDGTLNEEELEKLFHTIDSDNTNNVDTKELCDYFADHMGDYEDVLASLETLNLSILKAMDYTKRVYESGSNETANQTQSLLSSVESAVDAIDEQTQPARHCPSKAGHGLMDTWYDSPVPSYSPTSRMVPREHGKSLQSGSPDTKAEGLEGQSNRQAELIGRLEDKVRAILSTPGVSLGCPTTTSLPWWPTQKCPSSSRGPWVGVGSLVVENTTSDEVPAATGVTAVKLPDGVTFIVYEFWETEEDWKR